MVTDHLQSVATERGRGFRALAHGIATSPTSALRLLRKATGVNEISDDLYKQMISLWNATPEHLRGDVIGDFIYDQTKLPWWKVVLGVEEEKPGPHRTGSLEMT